MSIGSTALYYLARIWPAPIGKKNNEEVFDEQYNFNYALQKQFLAKLTSGLKVDFYDKDVLEIGCGHGGISTLMAICGAKKVVGIDINTENLQHARNFSKSQEKRLGLKSLKSKFIEMSANDLKFEANTFDVVIADCVFEHFLDPQLVLDQCYNILKPKGILIVPRFSSIYSKHALHLKTGLKIPWTNLFFSEKTIVKALYRMAERNNYLFEAYPGLVDKPEKVRNVRKYGDLNDITYSKFRAMSKISGFKVKSFNTIAQKGIKLPAAIIRKVPFLRTSIFADIFSVGAQATLIKN
jgi:ubiquinone/menaquinone biosynthesis C-methylase UbiE